MLQPADRRDPLTADLATLTLGSNPLTPEFDPDVTSYTASVSEASTSLTLTTEDEHATVTVMLNGTAVAASQGAYALTWTEGANTLAVTVVNGEWSKTYTVAVTYTPAPGGPKLATLGLTGLTLDPEFDPDTYVYDAGTSSSADVVLEATLEEGSDADLIWLTVSGEGVTAASLAARVTDAYALMALSSDPDLTVSEMLPFDDGSAELNLADGALVIGVVAVSMDTSGDTPVITGFSATWIDLTVES